MLNPFLPGPRIPARAGRPLAVAALCLAFLAFPPALRAAEWTVEVADRKPPAEVPAGWRGVLREKVVRVLKNREAAFEFWFRDDVPLTGKSGSSSTALNSVAQATPLGVVSVPNDLRDYRDNDLFSGLYTVRMGYQPQDGDHLGTSDYAWFFVLIPAEHDAGPDAIRGYQEMVEASGRETPTGHPIVLSLRPVDGASDESPRITQPVPDHVAVRLRLPGIHQGESIPIPLELVVEGHAAH